MKIRKLLLVLTAFFFCMGSYAESQLINRIPENSIGKITASIHSYSHQANWGEGAYNLLLNPALKLKWCDNSSVQPWVVIELLDYYDVDKFEFRDVKPFEKNFSNVAAYQISVATEYPYDPVLEEYDESVWEVVVDKTETSESDVKTDVLDAPKRARYVKFQIMDKGVRTNGETENACRIYGFDIYGTFAEKVDRGDLISVGKTILDFYRESNQNPRETAINLLDGNTINISNKWCFGYPNGEAPYRYAIIDLEKQYEIDRFRLLDCQLLESAENLYGCNIYVSEWAPDLSLIKPSGDENTCWGEPVVETDNEELEYDKDYVLATSVKGRFIKLEIPMEKIIETKTSRLFQFEVYGSEAFIPANDATLSLLSVSSGALSPSFSGNQTDYVVYVDKEVDSITITAAATNSKASVVGDGTFPIAIGPNPFDVEVTAENGSDKKTYSITIVRADKSKIATLKSLTVENGWFAQAFAPTTLVYQVDVPAGTTEINLNAVPTDENATVEGAGLQSLLGDVNDFEITVISEDEQFSEVYSITVYLRPEGLISVSDPSGKGKRIVNIHSYSGKANDQESPYKLLIGERLNTNGDKANKWCENNNEERDPWVIFSLPDIYYIEYIEFRDARLMDEGTNVDEYTVFVSTTGVEDEDWEEALYDDGVYTDNIKSGAIGMNARYIKFVPHKYESTHAVWIYGFDIYGTFAEEVNRGDLISVGKTIVEDGSHAGDRETPANLIDGNIDYYKPAIDENTGEDILLPVKCDPWAFNVQNGDGWATIDLEDTYDITKFIVYDTDDWISGYQVSISDNGTAWTLAGVTEAFDSIKIASKELLLSAPVRGRYVRLEVPVALQSENWNRIREFEVYGSKVVGLPSIQKQGDWMLASTFVKQGAPVEIKGQGIVKVYSVQGILMQQQTVAGAASLETSRLTQGCYILQCKGASGMQQVKLIVK
ncbi:MAG: discoidin domain-containing protein [Candidatus Symbiothrix sp.]|jgi:hypothetical protein|nr:discoidin domain-containing protein [Candidatus Symbiothrix sp.]